MLCEAHGKDVESRARVFEGHKRLSGEGKNVEVDERRGGPVATKTDEYIGKARTDNSFFSLAQLRLVSQGLLIMEASRSHSDTSHSVGLLWKGDQSDTETST